MQIADIVKEEMEKPWDADPWDNNIGKPQMQIQPLGGGGYGGGGFSRKPKSKSKLNKNFPRPRAFARKFFPRLLNSAKATGSAAKRSLNEQLKILDIGKQQQLRNKLQQSLKTQTSNVKLYGNKIQVVQQTAYNFLRAFPGIGPGKIRVIACWLLVLSESAYLSSLISNFVTGKMTTKRFLREFVYTLGFLTVPMRTLVTTAGDYSQSVARDGGIERVEQDIKKLSQDVIAFKEVPGDIIAIIAILVELANDAIIDLYQEATKNQETSSMSLGDNDMELFKNTLKN